MIERPQRSPTKRLPRGGVVAILAVLTLVAMTIAAPGVMAQGTIVVTEIPSDGWFQSPDNTAGGSVQLVEGPPGAGSLGAGSLELTTAANTDFAGLANPFTPLGVPYSDLTAGAWLTYVTGATGAPLSEAASLRLPGYQVGISVFTTLVVERYLNATVTPDLWQETTLDSSTVVWQTNAGDGFCQQAAPCMFGAFKAQYPQGRFSAVQIGIGTGVPAVTSYADGVTLTIDDETETFDFDIAGAPTPTPVPPDPAPATPAGSGVPDTSTDPSGQPGSALGIALGSLVLLSAVTVAIVRRRTSSR